MRWSLVNGSGCARCVIMFCPPRVPITKTGFSIEMFWFTIALVMVSTGTIIIFLVEINCVPYYTGMITGFGDGQMWSNVANASPRYALSIHLLTIQIVSCIHGYTASRVQNARSISPLRSCPAVVGIRKQKPKRLSTTDGRRFEEARKWSYSEHVWISGRTIVLRLHGRIRVRRAGVVFIP